MRRSPQRKARRRRRTNDAEAVSRRATRRGGSRQGNDDEISSLTTGLEVWVATFNCTCTHTHTHTHAATHTHTHTQRQGITGKACMWPPKPLHRSFCWLSWHGEKEIPVSFDAFRLCHFNYISHPVVPAMLLVLAVAEEQTA